MGIGKALIKLKVSYFIAERELQSESALCGHKWMSLDNQQRKQDIK